jgi:hypothetical protein
MSIVEEFGIENIIIFGDFNLVLCIKFKIIVKKNSSTPGI